MIGQADMIAVGKALGTSHIQSQKYTSHQLVISDPGTMTGELLNCTIVPNYENLIKYLISLSPIIQVHLILLLW